MNGLPKVTIIVNDDNLGQSLQTEDGIAGMLLTGDSVAGKIQAGVPVQVFSMPDAKNKGISETGINAYAYKHVKAFYDEAGDGAELWLLVDPEKDMTELIDDTAETLLTAAKGTVRLLGVSTQATGDEPITNGIATEAVNAKLSAQQLAESFVENYQDFSTIIDGKVWDGSVASLANNHEEDKAFVSVMLANSDGSKNASIGLLLGRLAKDPVQRNPARVKSGALPINSGFFTNESTIEIKQGEWNAIHDKGYIFMRPYVGRAGYFFTDAPTCMLVDKDLNSIPRVRTIYKARRIVYNTFVNEVLDEIPLEANGRIAPAIIKGWQANIENDISQLMVANGEASGVRCIIDPNQDILGTNELKVQLQVQPVGYAKYITVDLGFATTLTN